MLPFDPETDYYEILQVHPRAHQEVIKRAYRTIVRLLQAHPDLGGSHEEAIRVNEAYQILSHPDTRQAYDAAREQRRQAQAAAQRTPQQRPAPRERQAGTEVRRGHHASVRTEPRADLRVVRCSHCGTKNRLPATVDLQRSICGRCHALLEGNGRRQSEPVIPAENLRLSSHLFKRLLSRGDLKLERKAVPSDGRLQCLRCNHTWSIPAESPLPMHCPHCRSLRWSSFRLFCCRYCWFQFTTSDLTTLPYLLYPECPSCHQARWHPRSEQRTVKGFLSQLGMMLGAVRGRPQAR
ncbi:MAG: J domain-containing protein [Armatimonadota bacterium]